MACRTTIRTALALAVLLAPSGALAEDVFALLAPDEPSASRDHDEPATLESTRTEAAQQDEEAPEEQTPDKGSQEATSQELTETPTPPAAAAVTPAERMLAALVDAIPVAAPTEPGLVLVSDEVELVPMPTQIDPPVLGLPTLAEPAEQIPAREPAAPETALTRSILSVSLDASANAVLLEQLAELPDAFAIKDIAVDRFGAWDAPAREATMTPPRFAGTLKPFAAPAVYSRPLYFEQPNLERYGHHVAFCEHDNLTQSALSAAHFFASVPVLPYVMGANPPGECNYVLGAYRPGSCNPHELLKPRLSAGGGVAEGAAVAGLIFLIP